MDKIYIIGHKNPDLDSVAAAISYASLKNTLENTDVYTPMVPGDINKETQFVLERGHFKKPEILETAQGKNLILVDHNEFSQIVNGADEAKILEILDHHKLNFNYTEPIHVKTMPVGASCSMIYREYVNNNVGISKDMAGLMLAAILIDTIITKSPTCTEIDREIIKELAEAAEIADWKAFGLELFKVRSDIQELSNEAIIKADFKDFELAAGKFGIGQVETADLSQFANREIALIEELNKLKLNNNYHSVILFMTDIINEGSQFLVVTDDQANFEIAFNCKLVDNRVYIPGILSRKKQVVPMLSEKFDK